MGKIIIKKGFWFKVNHPTFSEDKVFQDLVCMVNFSEQEVREQCTSKTDVYLVGFMCKPGEIESSEFDFNYINTLPNADRFLQPFWCTDLESIEEHFKYTLDHLSKEVSLFTWDSLSLEDLT